MTIWRDIPGVAARPREEPAVVTIGNFDGVHRGHQHLLAAAAAAGRPVVAVTFDPHPARLFAPDNAPKLLCTLERRIELLRENGADEIRVLAFDREIAGWTPAEFIERVIVGELRATAVVVGENFHFGAQAAGDVATLVAAGAAAGFTAEGVSLATSVGGESSDILCSTLVRNRIAAGDMPGAAAVLGRPHEVSGVVQRGDGRGKDLGFPTANVPVDEGYAVPPDGVYAGFVVVGAERHQAAISVGTNPTFGGIERRVESFVLDAPGGIDLYDRGIRVEFIQRLRGMEAFDTVDALVAQMHDDVASARGLLN
ncbi:MAG TPA: bifunctional riboflavin kinase/FAD synthetase [Aeromicrobium sp.]|nr:bifunctional riboflavin kinase/FAD synthetase [Aeromicrobium sp.]